ncbi:hypothetical protein FPSE_02156 [Fusarium pseudograminearum CS3096]|uniref:RBR-type E3 ubiquitin transferase n=1 Tax=Fusarium pseudograminearum (strain CS3096) TaxID=1028729 RepID=K3VU04_FUSPC|nr:hypothetical protein FPSE_02156 [Fusarium pseudograminearum CS3096]EKJ77658.1 hypothetical protein FPSE_02156 [Fusarium pseudograminearum CS3096]
MDTESLLLALQLQQQDMQLWGQSRKGKQREGEITDADLAFESCRHELDAMTAQISDHILALSIARAVESDGQVIREAQLAEEQAARDHEFALMLSNDPSAGLRPATVDINEDELTDVTEDDMIDILRSLNLGDFPYSMSGQPESSSWALSRNESQTAECIACNDQFPPLALFRTSCSHEYCRACLVGLVRSSLQDESLFPPKCCGQTIPIKQGRWFSPQLIGQFQAKKLELDTSNRVYCSEPFCSTFIPPVFIAGETATCPKCDRKTCIHCNGPRHTGVCPNDTASRQVLQLADQNGWQQCYSCHRVVELETGCYHMTCHCRAEFCYLCGGRWKSCTCPQWEEARLIRRANVVVDRDDNAGRMNAALRQARVEEERVNLMENHECTHANWEVRAGNHQCVVALTGSKGLPLATSVYQPLSYLDQY